MMAQQRCSVSLKSGFTTRQNTFICHIGIFGYLFRYLTGRFHNLKTNPIQFNSINFKTLKITGVDQKWPKCRQTTILQYIITNYNQVFNHKSITKVPGM